MRKRKESAMNLGFPAVNETPLRRKESQEEEQFGKESWGCCHQMFGLLERPGVRMPSMQLERRF